MSPDSDNTRGQPTPRAIEALLSSTSQTEEREAWWYYRNGNPLMAARLFGSAAELLRNTSHEGRAWILLRQQANALMWGGERSKATSLLFSIANSRSERRVPEAAFCAFSDLLFMSFDTEPLAQLQLMRGDCLSILKAHGNDGWTSRLFMLDAILAWMRGDYGEAFASACQAWDRLARCDILPFSHYTHAKWAAITAVSAGQVAFLADELPGRLSPPSDTESFDQLRWLLVENLRARALRSRGGLSSRPDSCAESGLALIARYGGIWEERYTLLRSLLVDDNLKAYERWSELIVLDRPFEASLIRGDYFLQRHLRRFGLVQPDWDFLRTNSPVPDAWPATPGGLPEDLSAACENYAQAHARALLEDCRLQGSGFRRELGRRLAFLSGIESAIASP